MSFKEELGKRVTYAESVIMSYLAEESGFPKKLIEAMNYSMKSGGKRIRPVLMLESYRFFGGHEDLVKPFMAAMEMVHTHSLIHDDLPAIDNDQYRRGKLTTHAVYGEAMAVLAGDALLNYAYETAMKAFALTEDQERVVRALSLLLHKTGVFGMLGGQSVDVANEKNNVFKLPKEELDYIYLNKTAAFLEAPLMIGAILAGADEASVQAMETIGRSIGLAFQIQDDILDVTSTLEELGKPVFSDEKNQKTTYASLFGVEKAGQYVKELSEEAKKTLSAMDGDKEFLLAFISYMAERKN